MTSLLYIFIKIPIGVTTKKKITPIIIGDIIFPSKNPIFIQRILKNVSKFGLIKVVNRNIKDKVIDQILIGLLDVKG
jgi:hypothetical protein